jgi:hypothetical protein
VSIVSDKILGEEDVRAAITKRSHPQAIRTTFVRAAAPHLDALGDIDDMVDDVRETLTSRPPTFLHLKVEVEPELEGVADPDDEVTPVENPARKPKGGIR